jgi:hypothetical protein
MDEHLDGLSKHVHEALKRLKMGETGAIAITKEYPAEEVELYTHAYAMHKRDPARQDRQSGPLMRPASNRGSNFTSWAPPRVGRFLGLGALVSGRRVGP